MWANALPDKDQPNQTANSTLIGEIQSTKLPIYKKPIFWSLILILIVFVLIFVGFRATKDNRAIKSLPSNLNSAQKEDLLIRNNNYSAAIKLLDQEYASANTVIAKQQIRFRQSSIALQYKNVEDAQAYAQQAYDIDANTAVPYVAFANIEEYNGNKQEAIKNWQLAIEKTDPQLDGANLIIIDYQNNIKKLKS